MKIGPGAPPIKTAQGWLCIYHGVFQTMAGSVYRLGVALHDLNDPAKIIGVGDSWIYNRKLRGKSRVCSQRGVHLRRRSRDR